MSDTAIVYDKEGNPVLVKNSVLMAEAGVAEAEPPASPAVPPGSSGEEVQPSEHQISTSSKPSDVPWDEWNRRQGAVRTLAREFDEVGHGDIREFLQGKLTRDLSDEEVSQLHHDIQAHRISDIADILDGQLRSTVDQLKRSRRTVRVSAPRGWMRRAFNNLDERGIEQVCAQLVSRGHDPDTIETRVVSRVSDESQRESLAEKLKSGKLKVEV